MRSTNSPEKKFVILRVWIAHQRSLAIIAFVIVVAFHGARIRSNPAGFYLDESSIAFNAHSISQSGRDEHGSRWPLFFRAFGDYKNPVYVYLLAALYKITGPSILGARLLSNAGGVVTALLLGMLAMRITDKSSVGFLVAVSSLLTPWLFEASRFVLEVALYPLTLALFLYVLHRVASLNKWANMSIAFLAITLALVTYCYSIGRLLGPLLALGLAFFITRERWWSICKTWCAYLVLLVPIFVFNWRHPGALTARFNFISYLSSSLPYSDLALGFVEHYLGHLNVWRLLLAGKANPDIFVNGHMLVATVVFALVGVVVVLRYKSRHEWWRFILYGLAASLVPASLTQEYFHLFRLIPVTVFVLVLSAPGMAWLIDKARGRALWRVALSLLLAATLVQAVFFQWKFHASANTPKRLKQFDADYEPVIFRPAIASSSNPIYLADFIVPGYINAYWYGTLDGINLSRFVRLSPSEPLPEGALVISTEKQCPRCKVIAARDPYAVYSITGRARVPAPLAREGLKAELQLVGALPGFRSGEPATLRVLIKNASEVMWSSPERVGGSYQVSLGNHWLNSLGGMLKHDDGRTTLLEDLKPGETRELTLTVNAPAKAGDYILEIDMLQESVAWFGSNGSPTLKLPLKVE